MFVVHLTDMEFITKVTKDICVKNVWALVKFSGIKNYPILYHITHITLDKKNELPAHDAKQLLLTINDKTKRDLPSFTSLLNMGRKKQLLLFTINYIT